jgi:hypothetical protein
MNALKFIQIVCWCGIISAILALSNSGVFAASAVMDFSQLTLPTPGEILGGVPNPYHEDGFILTAPGSALRFPIPGSSLYPNSIAVFNEYKDGVTVLRAEDNRVFSMQSVALTLLTGNADVTSHFSGLTPLGAIVTVDFARFRSPPNSFITDHKLTTSLFPPSFAEVVEVSWVDTPSNQLGNAMVVDDLTMTFVPEPSTIILAAVAFAALPSRRRKPIPHNRV